MDEHEGVPVMKTDATLGEQQSIRLGKRLRQDSEKVATCLQDVRRCAATEENLFPAVLEAVRARATLGEIINVMKDEFGTYTTPSGF